MSAHRTGIPAPELIARIRDERRLLDGDTDVMVGVAELITLADTLTQAGVDVRLVEREPTSVCDWCMVDPARPAEVAVYGDPAPDDPYEPLRYAEVCRVCAPRAARQALIEQNPNSRQPIIVQIGVTPQ